MKTTNRLADDCCLPENWVLSPELCAEWPLRDALKDVVKDHMPPPENILHAEPHCHELIFATNDTTAAESL